MKFISEIRSVIRRVPPHVIFWIFLAVLVLTVGIQRLASEGHSVPAPVEPAAPSRPDQRAITIPIGVMDAANPAVREGQRVDLLLLSGRPEDGTAAVLFLAEDLEVLHIAAVEREPSSPELSISNFETDPAALARLSSRPSDFEPVGAYLTLSSSSLEAMLLSHTTRANRIRVLPRVNEAGSHVDLHSVLKVEESNFMKLVVENLSRGTKKALP